MSDRLLELLDETAQHRLRELPTTSDPVGRVDAAVRKDRTRRAGAAAAGAALSVVLVLVVVLGAVPRLTADPAPPSTSEPGFPAVVRTISFNGQSWPVAGALATDEAFVNEVQLAMARATSQQTGQSYRPTVLFAADLLDRRIVVARDQDNVWVASGAPGAGADALEGTETAYSESENIAGITVLITRATKADLLVLAPAGKSIEVATAPAVWPATNADYRPVTLKDGVAVAELVPTAPFGLTEASVTTFGRDGTDLFPTAMIALDDRTYVLTPEEALAKEARDAARTRFFTSKGVADDQAAKDAGDQTLGFSSFEVGDAEISLAAREAPRTGVDVLVAQAVHGGVRSRMLYSYWGDEANPESEFTGPLISAADQVDPRPMTTVASDRTGGLTVFWCGVAGATITYRSLVEAAGITHQVPVDAQGFAVVNSEGGLVAIAVSDAGGHELWRLAGE